MSCFLYRILPLSALCAAMATGAFAQQSDVQIDADHDHEHGAAHSVCGTLLFNDGKDQEVLANTARNNPDLYRTLMDRTKRDDRRVISSSADGVIFPFVVRNRTTGEYDQISALLVYQGDRARIWVDVADTARVKQTTINSLARGLDSVTTSKSRNPQQSIIENVEQVFGEPPLNRFDNPPSKIQDFLLTDIKDGLQGAFVAGFFSPWDQTDFAGSNRMNLLYIDSREGLGSGVTEVLSTLAHEYQHLIHYRTNQQSEIVFNEGCSEVASIVAGYLTRSNDGFLNNTNVPMFKWNHDDGTKILADYQRAQTFVHYMYEQYGEPFLTTLAQTKSSGMDRVADALEARGISTDWRTLFSSWAVANFLGSTFSQPYAYKTKLSTRTAKATMEYASGVAFPNTASVAVQQYATAYYVYNKVGPVKVRFSASQPIRVMAILYSGSKPVEVWQLDDKTEYTIGNYDKVAFAIVNLAFNTQTVNWTIDKVTLSAGDDAGTVGNNSLALTSVAPNPANGAATVSFTTANAGPVTVQIYDTRGELVSTVADGERFEAGSHQLPVSTDGLSTGAYVVRLTQGNRTDSHVMVVLK